MSDERTTPRAGEGDILAELEAEVAHELEEHRPAAGGPAYQVVAALVTLAIGLLGAVLAQGYGLGSLERPGPGLWPMVVSVVIVVLSLTLLLVGRGLRDSERFSRASVLPLVGVATFIALAFLIPTLGFEIPAFLLCVVWLRFLGGESWRSTLAVSLGTVAAFYALFLYGLRIPLPHLF
ncbi:tripartite tricarboxylate transporter TctB family protein [Nocardioides renjunii]|uniref:tripartite tricarboxylate transporter TctB family protein n=1 Tax=Nocardioides renjunii TaxID=3095075 RepID=UPI002AFFF67B|nr:tripartite tricarboxylate transporter TctB family protein [Nocardioides sp. S-34]WQQ21945.1 tripartite tricarboxylate transporter TctB family protein [Nocardioides sp. S-34]